MVLQMVDNYANVKAVQLEVGLVECWALGWVVTLVAHWVVHWVCVKVVHWDLC